MENLTELEVNYGLNYTFDRPGKIMERSPLMVSLKPDISGLKSVTVTMHLNSNPLPVDRQSKRHPLEESGRSHRTR